MARTTPRRLGAEGLDRLLRLLDIRPGEAARALLMFADLFLIIASFYILKPVRSSVFLVSFGPRQLPYVFILIALVGGGVASIYSSFARRQRLNRLAIASSALTASVLVLFRLLLGLDQGWVSYAFYVVVSLYGVITTSQFWLLANNIFDPREARRLFGFIGAGGIAGSIAGSAVASTLSEALRVENLILVAAGLLGLSIAATALVWPLGARQASGTARRAARMPAGEGGMGEMLGLVRRSRHLRLLTATIGLTVIASTLVDYVFSTEAYNHFAVHAARDHAAGSALSAGDKAALDRHVKTELTAFFGRFFGLLSLVSLILQVAVVGRILRALGVTAANLFLPLGLLIAAGGMVAVPGLLMAGAARLIDGALSYSINRAGSELLFIPLPLAIKNRTKTFIDMFTDRLARGVAGGLLLIATAAFGLGTRGIALVLGGVVGLWLLALARIRHEYLAAFRRAIAGRTLDVEGIREMVRSPDAIRTLAGGLAGDERQVLYTLSLLEGADSDLLAPHLAPLLAHRSAEVRRLAMRKLAASGEEAHRSAVEPLLADPVRAVRREAARYLGRTAPEGEEVCLRAFLSSPDWRVRAAALEVVAGSALEDGTRPEPARDRAERREWIDGPLLDSLLDVEGPGRTDARVAAARAIAALDPDTPHTSRLDPLLDDPDPVVRAEAMAAAAAVRDPRPIGRLLEALRRPRDRRAARGALAAYGEGILPLLGLYLDDETLDLGIRAQIPGAVGLMQSQPAVDFLLERIQHPVVVIRFQVIKALGKMRARDGSRRLRFATQTVEASVVEEARDHFELAGALAAWRGAGRGARGDELLLHRALGERLDQNLERIFRILGLRYPPDDMRFAYNGVTSGRQAVRASAIEFLDNLMSPRLKRVVLPAVAEGDPRALAARGAELFRLPARARDDHLRGILAGNDSWLIACAIDAVREMGLAGFEAEIAAHRASRDPIVREAAGAAALARAAGPGLGEP